VFIDTGLLRANEAEEVVVTFGPRLRLVHVDASERFLRRLTGVGVMRGVLPGLVGRRSSGPQLLVTGKARLLLRQAHKLRRTQERADPLQEDRQRAAL
jgi:hypothetical protein